MADDKNTNTNPQTTVVNVTQKVRTGGGCGMFVAVCIAALVALWGIASCNDALKNRTGAFSEPRDYGTTYSDDNTG